jgi:hypothetical protein
MSEIRMPPVRQFGTAWQNHDAPHNLNMVKAGSTEARLAIVAVTVLLGRARRERCSV